jgi:polyhydroxyalkanoate synthesis repressor PhaR
MSDLEPQKSTTLPEPKVIKRYTNRKLYDTVESRYVTLEEIAEMVKGGAEVKIVDNKTKEDLTSVTMAQIIFEEEKKTSKMPLSMLRDIIRTGGNSVQQFFNKEWSSRVQTIRDEAEKISERLFKREGEGDVPGAEGAPTAPPAEPTEAAAEPAVSVKDAAKDAPAKDAAAGKDAAASKDVPKVTKPKVTAKELMAQSTKAVEDWQRKLDERIKAVVEGMTSSLPAMGRDMAALEKQIQDLEARIKELEK